LEQRNKSIFGYEKHQVGDSSKWWFDNIHLKTASKCLLLIIFFRTKPTIGKMNTALNVLTTPINTYLIGVSSKDENGKAIRMIRAIQDIKAKKKSCDLNY
jgi:hypothetical protein